MLSMDKSYALTSSYHKGNPPERTITKHTRSMVAEPVEIRGGRPLSEREMDYMVRDKKRFDYGYIQHADEEKAKCITANISKGVPYNVCIEPVRVGTMPNSKGEIENVQSKRVYSIDGKSVALQSQGGGDGAKTGLYAEPYVPDFKIWGGATRESDGYG